MVNNCSFFFCYMGSLYGIDRGILIIRLYKKVVEILDS